MQGSRPKSQRGFTLIELLIALAIVAILTTVAFPLYNTYQLRSHRAQATADLGVCAQALERLFTREFSYEGGAVDPAALPSALTVCPTQSPQQNPRYDIQLSAVTDGTFTLQAVPIAGGPQADDGTLQLEANGRRSWIRNGAVQEGWEE